MASNLYDNAKALFLTAGLNLGTDTIKAVLVDTGVYTFSAAHQFLSSVTGTVGTAQTLASKTTTAGVFDAADVSYTAVSGASVEAVIVYKDTGSAATSPLIAYLEFTSLTPNGGDISVQFDNGASKIFAL